LQVDVPAELSKATLDLNDALRLAFARQEKNPPDLLKTLWLNPAAIFFVSDKESAQFLSPESRAEHLERKAELERLRREAPPAPALANGIVGGGTAMPVYVRGNVERAGEPAPPGFPRVLSPPEATASKKFTRLELAEAIASPRNPLTARVIVNRVWHY